MRILDRFVAVLLAAVLLVVGAVTAIEVIASLVGKPSMIVPWHRLSHAVGGLAVYSATTLIVCIAAVLIGLLLIWTVLRRTRPSAFTLRTLGDESDAGADSTVEAGASRKALCRAASERAGNVGGVYQASASLPRRKLSVSAATRLRDPGDLRDEVRTEVQNWIDGLGLIRPPKVTVRLRRKGA